MREGAAVVRPGFPELKRLCWEYRTARLQDEWSIDVFQREKAQLQRKRYNAQQRKAQAAHVVAAAAANSGNGDDHEDGEEMDWEQVPKEDEAGPSGQGQQQQERANDDDIGPESDFEFLDE